jgi:hypothetical protein
VTVLYTFNIKSFCIASCQREKSLTLGTKAKQPVFRIASMGAGVTGVEFCSRRETAKLIQQGKVRFIAKEVVGSGQ